MTVRAIFLSIIFCCCFSSISSGQPKLADSKSQVENPLYTRWAKFKPGTTALIETVTENPKLRIEQTTLYKLTEVTDSKAVVDITIEIRQAGRKDPGPAQTFTHQRWFTLPPGRTKDSIIKPANYTEEGTETLTIGGKEYKTTWYKSKSRVEAGDTFMKEWYSDDAPGGLIKEENETPAAKSKTKRELVEIFEPK
jgi:hypothetical protein